MFLNLLGDIIMFAPCGELRLPHELPLSALLPIRLTELALSSLPQAILFKVRAGLTRIQSRTKTSHPPQVTSACGVLNQGVKRWFLAWGQQSWNLGELLISLKCLSGFSMLVNSKEEIYSWPMSFPGSQRLQNGTLDP